MEELHPSPDFGLAEFELSPSVWDLILRHCPEKEVSEVGRVLGHSLVEQARDLQQEATMLLEIWRQFREESDDAISTASANPRLPEPPALRERLIQEVRFFVEHLRQKSVESGRSIPALSEGNRNILDYVTRTREGDDGGHRRSRPMSAVSSRDGRETPLRYTPTSDEGSQSSVLSDRVVAVSEQVNIMEVDTVTSHLRQLLEEECAQRREDIRFLQQCLEGEQSFQRSALEEIRPQPSIQELRVFGTQLEQEILQEAQFRPPPSPHGRPVPRPPPLPHNSSCPRNIHINRASKVRRRDPNPTNSHTSSRAASLPSPNTAHTTNPQKTKRLESELSHCKPQRTFPVSAPSAANNSQTTAHCTPFASPTVDDHELSLHVSNLHSMQDHPQNTSTAVFASPTVDDRELSLHVSNLHSMQDHPQNTSTAVSYTLDGNPIT